MVLALDCGTQCYLRSTLVAGVGGLAVYLALRTAVDCLQFDGKPGNKTGVKDYALVGSLCGMAGPIGMALLTAREGYQMLRDMGPFLGPMVEEKMTPTIREQILTNVMVSEFALVPLIIASSTLNFWKAESVPGIMLFATGFGIVLPYGMAYGNRDLPRNAQQVVAHISDVATAYPDFLLLFFGVGTLALATSAWIERHRQRAEHHGAPLPKVFDYVGHLGSTLLPWMAVLNDSNATDDAAQLLLVPTAVVCYAAYVAGFLAANRRELRLTLPTKASGALVVASVPTYAALYGVSYAAPPAINACAVLEWVGLLAYVTFVYRVHAELYSEPEVDEGLLNDLDLPEADN